MNPAVKILLQPPPPRVSTVAEFLVEPALPPPGMISLQVAEIDIYTRLWCIFEMEMALQGGRQIVFVQGDRYKDKFFAPILAPDPPSRQTMWQKFSGEGLVNDAMLEDDMRVHLPSW